MKIKPTPAEPKALLEPVVDKVTRNVSYKLSRVQTIDAIIAYLRQRGIHAPDQDRAEYSIYERGVFGERGFSVSWEEPA